MESFKYVLVHSTRVPVTQNPVVCWGTVGHKVGWEVEGSAGMHAVLNGLPCGMNRGEVVPECGMQGGEDEELLASLWRELMELNNKMNIIVLKLDLGGFSMKAQSRSKADDKKAPGLLFGWP